jgi:hypothetical protein
VENVRYKEEHISIVEDEGEGRRRAKKYFAMVGESEEYSRMAEEIERIREQVVMLGTSGEDEVRVDGRDDTAGSGGSEAICAIELDVRERERWNQRKG